MLNVIKCKYIYQVSCAQCDVIIRVIITYHIVCPREKKPRSFYSCA